MNKNQTPSQVPKGPDPKYEELLHGTLEGGAFTPGDDQQAQEDDESEASDPLGR